jgi:hypothetical protein
MIAKDSKAKAMIGVKHIQHDLRLALKLVPNWGYRPNVLKDAVTNCLLGNTRLDAELVGIKEC